MIEIEHAGDAVEAEAVEAEFFEPEAAVGEQEALDFVFAVIEEEGIPAAVEASGAGVEILMIGAVEMVEAFVGVFDGVAVDDIQEHADA